MPFHLKDCESDKPKPQLSDNFGGSPLVCVCLLLGLPSKGERNGHSSL